MWESLSAQRGPGRGGGAGPRPPQLADPPAIKELVRAEVKMLLQTLRERSSAGRRFVATSTSVLSEDWDMNVSGEGNVLMMKSEMCSGSCDAAEHSVYMSVNVAFSGISE